MRNRAGYFSLKRTLFFTIRDRFATPLEHFALENVSDVLNAAFFFRVHSERNVIRNSGTSPSRSSVRYFTVKPCGICYGILREISRIQIHHKNIFQKIVHKYLTNIKNEKYTEHYIFVIFLQQQAFVFIIYAVAIPLLRLNW